MNDHAPAMSVEQYDRGWETKWDDMKRHGPMSRHIRRLIMNAVRPLSFKDVLDLARQHKVNMRTAAYMLSISRVATVHRLRGIYA